MTRNPIHRSGLVLMALLLSLSPLAGQEEAATRELLRDGLYAEEVTRDAEKAAEHYQKVLDLHDQQRPFAATALFRLAEVRRKQDRKEDAAKLYQRLIREFPTAEEEQKLARENLNSMGVAALEDDADPARSLSADAKKLEFLKKLAKSSPDRIGDPLLFQEAIAGNEMESLAFLLKTAGTPENSPLLPFATERGSLESVRILLEKGVDPNAEGEHFALPRAAKLGHIHIAKALLAGGADINWTPDQCSVPTPSAERSLMVIGTPLMEAIATGQAKMIDLLLEAKADVKKAARGTGYTALHIAAGKGDTAMVKRLLDAGAHPNAVAVKKDDGQSSWGSDGTVSPLDFALQRGFPKAADLIAKAGGKIHDPAPLREAVRSNDTARVRELLKLGADPNAGDGVQSLLFQANRENAALLLEAGADPNATTAGGQSVLASACLSSHWEIANLLLDKGADPDAPTATDPGITPFVLAATSPQGFPTLERIVAKGAKPDPEWVKRRFYGEFYHQNRTPSISTRPLLFRHFIVQDLEDREEVRWVSYDSLNTLIDTLCVKTPSADPPPLAQALLAEKGIRWSIEPTERPIRLIIWRKGPDGKRSPIEFGFDDAAGYPPLKWGDVIEATVSPGYVPGPRPRESTQEAITWLLMKRVAFDVTFELHGKSKTVRVNGSRMVFDLTRNEVPFVGARGLCGWMGQSTISSNSSKDTISIQREGWPEITIPYRGSGADFPLQAGDKVSLRREEAAEDPARRRQVRIISPGLPFSHALPVESNSLTPGLLHAIAELEGAYQTYMAGAPSDPEALGPWMCGKGIKGQNSPRIFPHPDLSKITIRRLKEDGSEERILMDLSAALAAADDRMTPQMARGHDLSLLPGDIVEIPVRESDAGKPWSGPGEKEKLLLSKALDCQIQYTDPKGVVAIKSILYQAPRYIHTEPQAIPIPPESGTASFNAGRALGIYGRIRVSREETEPTEEITDCVYLRDGLRVEFQDDKSPRPMRPRSAR